MITLFSMIDTSKNQLPDGSGSCSILVLCGGSPDSSEFEPTARTISTNEVRNKNQANMNNIKMNMRI